MRMSAPTSPPPTVGRATPVRDTTLQPAVAGLSFDLVALWFVLVQGRHLVIPVATERPAGLRLDRAGWAADLDEPAVGHRRRHYRPGLGVEAQTPQFYSKSRSTPGSDPW
jgi:hypothetical protein